MDDDDLEVSLVNTPAARRARPFDLLVLGCYLVDEIAGAIQSATAAGYNLAAMHSNFLSQQAAFHEEAALEIETLTGEVDG